MSANVAYNRNSGYATRILCRSIFSTFTKMFELANVHQNIENEESTINSKSEIPINTEIKDRSTIGNKQYPRTEEVWLRDNPTSLIRFMTPYISKQPMAANPYT
eukprot:NODE_10_length_47437_cov_0.363429.p34 type:complete len:104 gc:universal NODE_10_length_47437_cov_0.363429:14855-14544(-)